MSSFSIGEKRGGKVFEVFKMKTTNDPDVTTAILDLVALTEQINRHLGVMDGKVSKSSAVRAAIFAQRDRLARRLENLKEEEND